MWGVKWCKEFDPSVELGTVLSQFVPTQIPFSNFGGKKVIFGSNGKYHAVFVTDDSIVWTFGYNNLGQAKKQQMICSFIFHFTLFSFKKLGNGEYGQLGNVEIYKEIPQRIDAFCRVKSVCCGFNFTIVLSVDGTVFCWGMNDKGEI